MNERSAARQWTLGLLTGLTGTIGLSLLFGGSAAAARRGLSRLLFEPEPDGRGSRSPEPPNERQQQYAAALERLVARAAAKIRNGQRACLGSLRDLAPHVTGEAPYLDATDTEWLAVLEQTAHRHRVSYELVTDETGGTLWLIPIH